MLEGDLIKKVLQNDGVIAFVTDTVWGLGCLPSSKIAVEKIYKIKHREARKPLILMAESLEKLLPYVEDMPEKALELAQKHFPGALTLVLKKSDLTPDYVVSGGNTVGIRVPNNKTFQKICIAAGSVLATTSANLSGEAAAMSYDEAFSAVGGKVDLVVKDFGERAEGIASTVVGVFNEEIKIFRQGKIKISA